MEKAWQGVPDLQCHFCKLFWVCWYTGHRRTTGGTTFKHYWYFSISHVLTGVLMQASFGPLPFYLTLLMQGIILTTSISVPAVVVSSKCLYPAVQN